LSVVDIEQAIAFEKTASKTDIEQPKDVFAIEGKRPGFELLDAPGGERGADHRAHRATGDKVGCNAVIGERTKYPDMRPTARRAAAER
jgi:hypothetical protein